MVEDIATRSVSFYYWFGLIH